MRILPVEDVTRVSSFVARGLAAEQFNVDAVYIRRLRNKVDDRCEPSLMRTVRSVDYTVRHGARS